MVKDCNDRSPGDTGALLPLKLVEFFKKRPTTGCYVPQFLGKDTEMPLSYCGVLGEDAEQPPEERQKTSLEVFFDEEQEPTEFPFTNLDPTSKRNADSIAKKVISSIYCTEAGKNIGDINKAYMINTRTTPIKVNFSVNGKTARRALFVKRPSKNRILGLFIYNIISGVDPIHFAFNDSLLAEQEVPGTLLYLMDESKLLRIPSYGEGVLRAAVHADFLALYHDVAYTTNRIVGSQYKTILFDFDNLFYPEEPSKFNYLLDKYYNKINMRAEKSFDIIRDEQYSVLKRVEENHDLFFSFVKLAGGFVSYNGQTIDQIVGQHYKAPRLQDYFTDRLETYKTVGTPIRENA